jgi:thiamine biosynthesis lipoprotein
MPGRRILAREALGSFWWVTSFEEHAVKHQNELVERLNETIDAFEANYSRFRADSLVGRLNRGETLKGFTPELFDLLTYGEYLRQLSGGVFNLGAGKVLKRLGYDEIYSFTAKDPAALDEGSPFATLTPESVGCKPGARLDLGGIGKGWLIDKLSELLKAEGLCYFAVNGGGDTYVTSDHGKPLAFSLASPLAAGESIGDIFVRDGAVAASGSDKRRWNDRVTGKERHHLIDPRTGLSSDRIAGSFTLGKSAHSADAASTLLYLAPDELTERIAEQLDVEYLLVQLDGTAVRSPGYPAKLNQ